MGYGTVRRGAVVLAALLLGATVPVAGTGGGAEPDTVADDSASRAVTPAERAAAIAEPAIVVVEVRWKGYVRDRATGELLDPEPVTASTRCSGVGVGGEGYLLTLGSCLRPAAVAVEAFGQLVDRRVSAGRIAPDQASDLLSDLLRNATIGDGPAGDEPPERSLSVRRAVTDDEPMPASVVAVANPDDGDAALLKITRNSQPILPLAEGVSAGDELVIVQCPSADPREPGATAGTAPGGGREGEAVQPEFRTGVVTQETPRVVIEPTEPGETGDPMPGGVVLSHDAAIVGLVDPVDPDPELAADSAVIRDLLAQAEVDTELGQVDRDFRAGLDAYYESQYTASIEHFDSVLAIIPSHVQAHEYRAQAQALREEQGGDEPAPPDAMDRVDRFIDRFINRYSGVLVGLGVFVAILFFLLHRRRPPHAAAAGDEVAPPEAPVSPPAVRSSDDGTEPAGRSSEADQTNA